MRVIVQNCKDHLFLGESDWVESPDLAKEFVNSVCAVEYCLYRDIRDVQLVLREPRLKSSSRVKQK